MATSLSTIDVIDRDISTTLGVGREVILVEGRALIDLADCLDVGFAEAVDLLVRTKQRVIVSGMGKSGHVARKIAATLRHPPELRPCLFVPQKLLTAISG